MSDAAESAALYRLMAWLSPAYPVGAFSYSSGIEWAVELGDIKDAETLRAWLAVMIGEGSGFCDAVFFVHAHRTIATNDDAGLRAVAELAAAMVPSKERLLETTTQGRAFLEATRAAWPCEALARLDAAWNGAVALPVAVGVTCAGHGIACDAALQAFLHALAANWISAGIRLIPLGQTDGQRVLAALEGAVAAAATARAQNAARRRRIERAAHRSRQHAARDPVHAPIPVVSIPRTPAPLFVGARRGRRQFGRALAAIERQQQARHGQALHHDGEQHDRIGHDQEIAAPR